MRELHQDKTGNRAITGFNNTTDSELVTALEAEYFRTGSKAVQESYLRIQDLLEYMDGEDNRNFNDCEDARCTGLEEGWNDAIKQYSYDYYGRDSIPIDKIVSDIMARAQGNPTEGDVKDYVESVLQLVFDKHEERVERKNTAIKKLDDILENNKTNYLVENKKLLDRVEKMEALNRIVRESKKRVNVRKRIPKRMSISYEY